jgi:hypothetical protein
MSRQQVPNYELASDTARANLLTNGGFEIWQRGTGPFTSSGLYTADRWSISLGTGDAMNVLMDNAGVDVGSTKSHYVAYTKGTGSSQILQYLTDFAYRGKTLSLSIRVNSTAVGAVQAGIYDGVNGWRLGPFNAAASSTWETLTVTAPIASNATSCIIGLWFQNTATVRMDNAMLVVGAVPCDYVPLHPADDLARCLRYYEKIGGVSTATWFGCTGTVGQAFGQTFAYAAKKAVVPTLTKAGTWTMQNAAQPIADASDVNNFRFYAVASASGPVSYSCTDATCFITAEANP